MTAVHWPLARRAMRSCHSSVLIPQNPSPKSQCSSHILSGMQLSCSDNYIPWVIPFYHVHTPFHPSRSFSLFPCLMLQKDKFSTFRRLTFHLAINLPDSACSFSFSFFLTTMYCQSLPLHRLKESWVPERSSNWNQHLSPSFTSLKRRSTFLNLWVPHELLQVLFFLCF